MRNRLKAALVVSAVSLALSAPAAHADGWDGVADFFGVLGAAALLNSFANPAPVVVAPSAPMYTPGPSFGYAPQPVYVPPQPVYVPPPAYYSAPPVTYNPPAVVYYNAAPAPSYGWRRHDDHRWDGDRHWGGDQRWGGDHRDGGDRR